MTGKPHSIEEAYRWVLERLASGVLTSTELSQALGADFFQRVMLFLNYLVTQGLVTRTAAGKQVIYSSERTADIARLVQKHTQAEPTASPIEAPTFAEVGEALVISAPLSLADKAAVLRQQYPMLTILDMKAAFKELFRSARKELILALPFLELDGLMYFTDEIIGLGQRQVVVHALTRELLLPRQSGYGHHQKLKAFAKFIDLYVLGGGSYQQIAVRDYTIRIGVVDDESLLYEDIHQKMIVADGERAYIGSGEIRASSFVSNGDVGVIHIGDKARFWRDYFDIFWSEANIVPHTFFQESIR